MFSILSSLLGIHTLNSHSRSLAAWCPLGPAALTAGLTKVKGEPIRWVVGCCVLHEEVMPIVGSLIQSDRDRVIAVRVVRTLDTASDPYQA